MSDIKKIVIPNGTTIFLKDYEARQTLLTKAPLASPALTGNATLDGLKIATEQYVNERADVIDAFQYVGTISNYSDLNQSAKKGWTYKVAAAFTYGGVNYESGDMFIRNTDSAGSDISCWDVIQKNLDGAVTGPVSSTDNHVALFDGATGKVVKDAGGTLQSLMIDDNASGIGALSKAWSAQKSINELAKKVNEIDLFAGIDIYDPNSASQGQFIFNANAYAHQIGTNYIVHNTGGGVYVVPPANLVDSCLSCETLTFTEYIQHIADNIIDDTAGDGDTGKTWSADKIYDQLALKAPKTNPEFTGSISLGRKDNTSVGNSSVASGMNVTASGAYSHAEGALTVASNNMSHAEGNSSVASGRQSHAEGFETIASGTGSHAEGMQTIAKTYAQHTFGSANIEDSLSDPDENGTYIEIVGNGYNANNRSNARTLDWDGNERLNGDLYINCNADSTGGTKLGDTLNLKMDKSAIDDTAGDGDTQKIWSANKLFDELALKAPKENPEFSGSILYGYNRKNEEYTTSNTSAWESNTHYSVGDVVYTSGTRQTGPGLFLVVYTYHKCIEENEDTQFDSDKWISSSEKTQSSAAHDSDFYLDIAGFGSLATHKNIRTLDKKGNEWLAGSLTLGSTTLTETALQNLLSLTSASGVSF